MNTITIRRIQNATYIDGWRVLHKVEGGYQKTPEGMPEVLPPDNPIAIPMTAAIQRMSFELMRYFNPIITAAKWTKVHEHDIAFTNYNGFGNSGDPRANHITGENLDKGLPKYDKAQRVCGGSFIHGDAIGGSLVCRAGVHGISADGPMPELETIVKNNWYIHAVTQANGRISHFPQGWDGADYYGPVVIPFIFKGTITFPIKYFEVWRGNILPDPLRVYKDGSN